MIGLAPAQAPAWQVSVRVQAFPSLQPVPLFALGLEQSPVASPYSTFVEFIEALRAGDLAAAAGRVADPSLIEKARHLDWGKPAGAWRIAPAADETPQRMVFFRGEKESYRVQFEQRGADFVITDFEAVSRSVE